MQAGSNEKVPFDKFGKMFPKTQAKPKLEQYVS